MRVDITLHEVSDSYEETSLQDTEIPRLPHIGETVELILPERTVIGKVTLVGHKFYAPGTTIKARADAWLVIDVSISTDNQGNATFRDEQGKILTVNPTVSRQESE
jgi:hypothetical protein